MVGARVSLILALHPLGAYATSGFDGSNNPSFGLRGDSTPYFYSSEITSFDDSPPEADDLIFNFVDADGVDCSDSVASVVASSLVYDNEDGGSCLVSSAIYGGNPLKDLFELFESDDEFGEDDDDDDDDDGHSSMLSNSHLYRSRALANGSAEPWKSRQSYAHAGSDAVVNMYTNLKSNMYGMQVRSSSIPTITAFGKVCRELASQKAFLVVGRLQNVGRSTA